jgi:glycosyltransferase involved in cell wall biosynthesis
MTPHAVHLVEPGGCGGVYHHAAGVAAALAGAGRAVVLHTAARAEAVPLPATVARRACSWRFDGLRPAAVRRAALAGAWLTAGVPSCLQGTGKGDVIQVEGWFVPALLPPLVAAARRRGCLVAYSPHNTFSRTGRLREERAVAWLARRADVVLVFSAWDRGRAEAWGAARVAVVPLVPPPVAPDPAAVAAWRARWGAGGGRAVVLFAGQVRPDKGLDVLVQAARGRDVVVAVVGENHGGLDGARRLAADLGVDLVVDEGYQPLGRFVAAVAAADAVACPYRRASQSAVLALARALGRPGVATDVGGLAELATVAVPAGDAAALAAGIARALAAGPTVPAAAPAADDVAAAYLAAYLAAYRGG